MKAQYYCKVQKGVLNDSQSYMNMHACISKYIFFFLYMDINFVDNKKKEKLHRNT